MPKVITVIASGNEEVEIYPECPNAEAVAADCRWVLCSLRVNGYSYCTAIRMKPSLCPLDVVGHCSV